MYLSSNLHSNSVSWLLGKNILGKKENTFLKLKREGQSVQENFRIHKENLTYNGALSLAEVQ